MKKTARPKRRKVTSRPSDIPPLVAAVAHLVDPCVGQPPDFTRAWKAMPDIVAAFVQGEGDSIDTTNAHSVIAEIVDDDIAAIRKAEDSFSNNAADAKDVLDGRHEDLWSSAYSAVEGPAFNCGLALGLYLALYGGWRIR